MSMEEGGLMGQTLIIFATLIQFALFYADALRMRTWRPGFNWSYSQNLEVKCFYICFVILQGSLLFIETSKLVSLYYCLFGALILAYVVRKIITTQRNSLVVRKISLFAIAPIFITLTSLLYSSVPTFGIPLSLCISLFLLNSFHDIWIRLREHEEFSDLHVKNRSLEAQLRFHTSAQNTSPSHHQSIDPNQKTGT